MGSAKISTFIFAILLFVNMVCGDGDVDTLLPPGYQKGQRPHSRGAPVDVGVTIYVNSFGNIEEAQMEYKIFGYYRQYWNDNRLAGRINESLVLKGEDIGKLWKPDPYCYNARESTLSASDTDINSMMTVEPNGDIAYSRMTIIVAECDMDLHDFPMDIQRCFLKFSSFSYTDKHIKMKWKEPEKVQVGGKNLAQFDFADIITKTYTDKYTLGNYSIVQVDFVFERRLGYFLIQVYAPDIFIVVLSWIVFWMDRNDMGNRMALGITTILTIMFLMGSINAAMPRVSYPKALDWYLMISFTLVFLSLIECTLVFVLASLESEAKEKAEEEAAAAAGGGGTEEQNENNPTQADPEKSDEKEKEKDTKVIKECDRSCSHRILWITDNPKYCMREGAELLELTHDPRRSGPSPILGMQRLCSIKHGSTEHEFVMPRFCGSRRNIHKRKFEIPETIRKMLKRFQNLQGIDEVVDSSCKYIFPAVFLLFNIVYWAIYL